MYSNIIELDTYVATYYRLMELLSRSIHNLTLVSLAKLHGFRRHDLQSRT
jgi:hypothetical protein